MNVPFPRSKSLICNSRSSFYRSAKPPEALYRDLFTELEPPCPESFDVVR